MGVEDAYAAYLKGDRIKPPNWKNSPLYLMQQANVAYIDGKVIKNRYGDVEAEIEWGIRSRVESWDEEKRILHLKTMEE